MPGQMRSRPNVARMTIHAAIASHTWENACGCVGSMHSRTSTPVPRGDDHGVAQIGVIAGPPMNAVRDKGQRVERLGYGADEQADQEKRLGARRH